MAQAMDHLGKLTWRACSGEGVGERDLPAGVFPSLVFPEEG